MTGGKKIVLILSIVLCVMLALTFIVGLIIYNRLVVPYREMTEIPDELREARIITGAAFLSKNQFIKSGKIESFKDLNNPDKVRGSFDQIIDIAVRELDGQPGVDIGIAGRLGAVIVDRQGNIKEHLYYQFEMATRKLGPLESTVEKMSLGDIQIIDIDGDGVCEYLGRGGMDGAAVFNHQGKLLWGYGEFTKEKTSIDDMTAGDLTGDGLAEFVALWNGVELFDRSGTKMWQQLDEQYVGQVEIVDTDDDGKAEILLEGGSKLIIKDAQGNTVNTVEMPTYVGHFSLCLSPDAKAPVQILTVQDGSIWLLGTDGKTIFKLDAPLSYLKLKNPRKVDVPGMDKPMVFDSESVYQAKGVWVNLIKEQPAYLAVTTRFAALDRSLFYVYDAQGKLVYQEVLPEASSSIAILEAENENGAQSLLVGGSETIWHYAVR